MRSETEISWKEPIPLQSKIQNAFFNRNAFSGKGKDDCQSTGCQSIGGTDLKDSVLTGLSQDEDQPANMDFELYTENYDPHSSKKLEDT